MVQGDEDEEMVMMDVEVSHLCPITQSVMVDPYKR